MHISAVEHAGISGLTEGQALSYDLENGKNGKQQAVNLKLANA